METKCSITANNYIPLFNKRNLFIYKQITVFRSFFSKIAENPAKKTAIFCLFCALFCNALTINENNFKKVVKK